MNIWSDDPEWFDEWIEKRAMEGDFGPELAAKASNGDILGYEIWEIVLKRPDYDKWFREATADYCERFVAE